MKCNKILEPENFNKKQKSANILCTLFCILKNVKAILFKKD